MALDAHSVPISKCLPYTGGFHKQHGGPGRRVLTSACTGPLTSQVLLCSRSRATVWTLCKEARLRKHHNALGANYWTEETRDAPMISFTCSMRPRTRSVSVHEQRGLPGQCNSGVSSLIDLSVRRRKACKSKQIFASGCSRFSTGTRLLAKCGLYTSQSKRRNTAVTAAATDSDQTSPSQNGGGEKELPKKPHPQVAPSEVVQAQLKALHNRDLGLVYEFASPANKAHTGPLSRFSEMLEARPYRVMLGHVSADVLSTVTIGPTRFQQRILIKGAGGTEAVFSWSLSKQEDGPYEGCWMTDTVRRDDR